MAAYIPRGSMGFQDFVLLQRPPDDVPGVVKAQPITVQPLAVSAAAAAVGTAGMGGAAGAPVTPVEDALSRAGRLLHEGYQAGLGEQGANATVRRMVDRAVRSRASTSARSTRPSSPPSTRCGRPWTSAPPASAGRPSPS